MNCDALNDHDTRECPKPRDYSRITCRNCNEKGHTVKRCPKPVVEDEAEGVSGDGGWGGDAAPANAEDGGWGGNADANATNADAGWGNSTIPTPGGGSGW